MRYTEIKPLTEETLLEVNMSPSKLRQMVKNIDAKVGMEFEFYLPDVETDDDDDDNDDGENDYSTDRPFRSLNDVEDFFSGSNEYATSRAISAIQDGFNEWLSEKADEDWNSEERELIEEYVKDNEWDSIQDDALEEIRSSREDADDEDGDQEELTVDHPDVQERAEEMLEERIDEIEGSWNNRIHQQLYERFKENFWHDNNYDETDYMNSEGWTTMYDIYRSGDFDLEWPDRESPEKGSRDLSDVASAFSDYTGYDAEEGEFTEDPPVYGVSFDLSLKNKDSATDGGVEFSSPPMPVADMITHLNAVRNFIRSEKGYTNHTCGLHISASIGKDGDYGIGGLDYVKLALLLGDEYVLKEFNRVGNRFAKRALHMIPSQLGNSPEKTQQLLDQMRTGLNNLSSKLIHSGSTEKFTSINNKGDYIEFRSAGNDWTDDKFFNKIENTTMRYIVALDAAMDPTKYRAEYLKKLSLLLAGEEQAKIEYYDPQDPANAKFPTVFSNTKKPGWVPVPQMDRQTTDMIAKYMAGEAAGGVAIIQTLLGRLKSEKAYLDKQYPNLPDRKSPANITATPKKLWWKVKLADTAASIELVADGKQEAINKARAEWNLDTENGKKFHPDYKFIATPVRPYTEPGQEKPNNWELYNVVGGHSIKKFHADSREEADQFRITWLRDRGLNATTNGVFQLRPLEQEQQPNFEVYTTAGDVLKQYYAADMNAARVKFQDYLSTNGISSPSGYGFRQISANGQPSTSISVGEPVRNLKYNIVHVRDGALALSFVAPNRTAAIQIFHNSIHGRNPMDFRLELADDDGAETSTQPQRFELYRISSDEALTHENGEPFLVTANGQQDADSKIARITQDFSLGEPEWFGMRPVQQSTAQQPPQEQQPTAQKYQIYQINGNRFVREFYARDGWHAQQEFRRIMQDAGVDNLAPFAIRNVTDQS